MDKIAESILKFLKQDSLVHHVTGYVEAPIELMKTEIREDLARAVEHGGPLRAVGGPVTRLTGPRPPAAAAATATQVPCAVNSPGG